MKKWFVLIVSVIMLAVAATFPVAVMAEETHVWGSWYHVEGTDQHARDCSSCGAQELEDCQFEEVLYYIENGFIITGYQCWVCGYYKSVKEQLATRIYGSSRFETSIKVAEEYMRIAGVDQLDSVVVTTGMAFPDALSGSYLSIKNGAPIILINLQDNVQNTALDFIKENVKAGGMVYLLGGKGVIPETFKEAVEGLGYSTVRYSGANRYETNINILEGVGVGEDLLVCYGQNYPDAATASATGKAILLVNGKTLTEEQKTFLKSIGKKNIYVIGGIGVISPELGESLAEYDNDGYAWRVAGTDRAVTAKHVAQTFFPEKVNKVVFACGTNFPDCISGGLLANRLGSPILYAGDHSTYIDEALDYCVRSGARTAYALGGTKAVSDYFLNNIFNNLY